MKSSHLILSLIVSSAAALLQVAPSYATTYHIVDYPTEQNGWSLSGWINTDGTVGTIQTNSLVNATWTIKKAAESYTSVTQLDISLFDNIVASSTDLRLDPSGISTMALSSNANQTMIEWAMGIYTCNTPGWGTAWSGPYNSPSALENNNYIIAIVPEPSTLVLLGIAALLLPAYAWRRMRPTG